MADYGPLRKPEDEEEDTIAQLEALAPRRGVSRVQSFDRARQSDNQAQLGSDLVGNIHAAFTGGKVQARPLASSADATLTRTKLAHEDEEDDPSSPSAVMARDMFKRALPEVASQMGKQFELMSPRYMKANFPFFQQQLLDIRGQRKATLELEQARKKEEQRLKERGEDQTRHDSEEQRRYANSRSVAEITAGRKRQEVEEAETRKRDDERRKASVLNYDIAPDAYPTQDDAKKLKAAGVAAEKMRGYAKDLRGLLQAHGPTPVGPVAEQMNQLQTAMQLEAKNIADLGALSGPDMGLMQQLAGTNPGSFFGTASAMTGATDPIAALDGLVKWTDGTVASTAKVLGYVPRRAAPDAPAPGMKWQTNQKTGERRQVPIGK